MQFHPRGGIETLSNPFTPVERDAWAPPEQLTTAEWADKYRVLGPRVAAEPGPYRTDRAPYCRGIMEALSDSEHTEVAVMKCVQCGGSELGRNWIGRCADIDPGPVMIVFPGEQAAKENIDERILPMFQDSPRLRRLTTGRPWDMKRGQVYLRSCTIYIGWSGSPQALASRPIRYLLLDEVDKYRAYQGKEADPISLAKDRTLTFQSRRKVYIVSTPTLPTGPIAQAFDAAGDRRYWHVPCAHCGHAAKPDWANVTWTDRDMDDEDALARIRGELETGAVVPVYECPSCSEAMDPKVWAAQSAKGQWVSEGCEPGEHPRSESVAFHVSGLISPWIGLQRLAVEFATAKLKGLAELQNFFNAFLGIPFWDESVHGDHQTSVGTATVWRKAAAGHKLGVVPEWATTVLAGADTGKYGHQYVVRAYGEGYQSRLLDYGTTRTSEELYERVFRAWPQEGSARTFRVRRLCVDSGGGSSAAARDASRTDEVYRWCKTDPAHLYPVKGFGGSGISSQPVITHSRTYHPPGEGRKPYDVMLSVVDTEYFKDLLASQINSEDDELWQLCAGVSRDYVLQMASEKKILVERRIKQGQSKDIWRWVPRAAGAANHFWDAENYALVAAYMLDMDRPRAPAEATRYQRAPKREGGGNSWQIGR